MFRVIFVALILFGNLFQSDNAAKFPCTISSNKQVYKLGEIPNFSVVIKNTTDDSVMFVKTLDGSAEKFRYPYCFFTIEKLGDTTYKIHQVSFCSNSDPIKKKDFVKVGPGNSFDPYHDQSEVYADYKMTDPKNFAARGKYKITFYYSTTEPDFDKWIGEWTGRWRDTANKPLYNELKTLFATVPQISLVSNSATIEIK